MTVYLQYYYKLKKEIYIAKKKYVIDNYNNNDHKTKSLSLSFYICQN